MKTGYLPKREYQVMIVPILEYITGIDILKGLTLNLDDGKYQFCVHMIKLVVPVVVGKLLEPPVTIPETTEVVTQSSTVFQRGKKRNY